MNNNAAKTLILKAENQAKDGRWLHAIQTYKQIINEQPDYIPAYIGIANIYLQHKQFDSAKEMLKSAIEIDKENEELIFIMGNAYLMNGEPSIALEYYKNIEKKRIEKDSVNNTEHTEHNSKEIKLAERKSKRSESITKETTTESNETGLFPELTYNIGLCYARMEAYNEAINYFLKTAELNQNFPRIYELIGDIYISLKDFKSAEEYLKIAKQKDPINTHIHYLLGFTYASQSLWDKSVLEFEKAYELDDDNTELCRVYGWALCNAGNDEKGMRFLRRSLELKPDNVHSMIDIGMVYAKQKNYELAEKELEKAIKIAPNDKTVLESLSKIQMLKIWDKLK